MFSPSSVTCFAAAALSMASALLLAQDPSWGPPPPVAPKVNTQLPDEVVLEPMIFPVLARCRWSNDYDAQRDGFHHAAIDIRAPKMSPIVAPISGTIGFKPQTFWIYGDDGWAVLGTHINTDNLGTHDDSGSPDVMFAPNLVPGQHVYAGQFLAYVGMSGDATGPHLHFELFKPGPGPYAQRLRNPYSSLKASQVIAEPRLHFEGPRPGPGEMRIDGCLRYVDPSRKVINIILLDKQFDDGRSATIFGPKYLRLKLSDSLAKGAGSWDSLQSLPGTSVVTCYLKAAANPVDSPILRFIAPKAAQPVRALSPSGPVAKLRTPPALPKQPTVPAPKPAPLLFPSVLVSLTHDFSSTLAESLPADIRSLGFASSLSLEGATKLDLSQCDVWIACHPSAGNFPYDEEEIGRLKHFVERDGGGLVLIGSANEYRERQSKNGPFAINKLGKQFRVEFEANPEAQPEVHLPELEAPPWATELSRGFPHTFDHVETTNFNATFYVNRPSSGPIIVGADVGAGRILAVAVSPDKLLELLGRQPETRQAFREAILWVCGKRSTHPKLDLPPRILPQMQLIRGRFIFHCPSVFTEQEARAYVDSFERAYEAERSELGVDMRESLKQLDVILVQTGGAVTHGDELSMGTSENLDRFMIESAFELARQWDSPGAMPGGFRDGWLAYCSLLAGLKIAKDTNNTPMLRERSEFQRLDSLAREDPSLTRIDPLRTDKSGVDKAVYMLMALQRKYGHDFWARFLPIYRSYTVDHPGACPIAKFVELLSQAAGQDLKPWFVRCGTTL